VAVLCLALLAQAAPAAAPPAEDPVTVLARAIDQHVALDLKEKGAEAAPLADDHEFVRRVYLDLAGRIPRVSEVRAFVDDRKADKRRRLVAKLLESNTYVNHFTNVWRALLLPNSNNQQAQFLAPQMEGWVRRHLQDNTPYDRMVRELLTTTVAADRTRPNLLINSTNNANAAAFFQANEFKAEDVAAATSRLFLGVKIECAQCHDHPFAKWTRKQFWEYAAFFGGMKPANGQAGVFGGAVDDTKVREITLPNSEKMIQAKFLDGTEPKFQKDSFTRSVLAEWLTRKNNPFFAKAAANRAWEHLFGIGLTDPVDDARDENPPSHPKLLDDLAQAFADADFDLKFLIKAITASKTYQRTALMTHRSQEDLRLFARMPLKGLTPEQIFDSLSTAVGFRGDVNGRQFDAFRFNNGSSRGEIMTKFANPVDRKTEWQTSILQALALMNGKFISDATSLDRSETLAAVIDSPFMNTRQKLDTLYLSALGRNMRSSEATRLVPYVNAGGPSRDKKKALADVFWVLLNSSEFILNH
jgi:hypothetical protein